MVNDPFHLNYGRKPTPEEIEEALEELVNIAAPRITGAKKVSVRVVALRRVLSALSDRVI